MATQPIPMRDRIAHRLDELARLVDALAPGDAARFAHDRAQIATELRRLAGQG